MDIYKTFLSISQFDRWLETTPLNKSFEGRRLSSRVGSKGFTDTDSYEEARDLMLHGWVTKIEEINVKFNINNIGKKVSYRDVLSIQGYHPVVPLYLAGVPQNMVNRKQVIIKQKVLTIDKIICYSCFVSPQEILENSIKALQIINSLENRGYRCNLYVVWAGKGFDATVLCRVKIKSANERLNLSKMVYPLIHPSMPRRMMFRFVEQCPDVPKSFCSGYGAPLDKKSMERFFDKHKIDSYIFDQFIYCKVEDIKSPEDLFKI